MKSFLLLLLSFDFFLVSAQKNKKLDNSESEMIEQFMMQLDDSTSAFIFPFTLSNSGESPINRELETDSILCRVIVDSPFNKGILFRIEGRNSDFNLTVKQEIEHHVLDNLTFTTNHKTFNSSELRNILNNMVQGDFFSLPRIQDGTVVSDPTFYSFELTTSERSHFTKGPHLNTEQIKLIEFLVNYGHLNELLDMEK